MFNKVNVKLFPYAFVIILWISLFYVGIFSDRNLEGMAISDYPIHYISGNIAREGKIQELYQRQSIFGRHTELVSRYNLDIPLMDFMNFPFAALLFAPFSLFSLITSYRIFSVLNLILTGISLFILFRIYKLHASDLKVLLMFLPLYFGVYYGQLSPLLLLILVGILSSIKTDRPVFAGVLSGLLIFKMQYLLLFPFLLLLVCEKKKFISSFLLTVLLYVFGNFIYYGTDLFLDWFKLLILSLDIHRSVYPYFNLFSMSNYLSPKLIFVISALLYILSIYILVIKNIAQKSFGVFSYAVIFVLLLNIHTTMTDLIFLVIPLVYFYMYEKGWRKYLIILTLCIFPMVYVWRLQWLGVLILLTVTFYNLLSTKTAENRISYKHAQTS